MKRIVGVTDLTPARWVQDALPDFGKQLGGSIIPGGFEAYARILHPASDSVGSTWREIADANGRALEPLSCWEDISPSDVDQPREGELELTQFDALVPLLTEATETPTMCWFALWHGYRDLTGAFAVLLASRDPDRQYEAEELAPPAIDVSRLPTFATPGREYYLFRAPVEQAPHIHDECSRSGGDSAGPNLWWPDDRAWFVASEIDLTSTYVGGTNELIESIVAAPELEAVRVDASGGYA